MTPAERHILLRACQLIAFYNENGALAKELLGDAVKVFSASPTDEPEPTTAMIDAGLTVFHRNLGSINDRDLIALIYNAMHARRPYRGPVDPRPDCDIPRKYS